MKVQKGTFSGIAFLFLCVGAVVGVGAIVPASASVVNVDTSKINSLVQSSNPLLRCTGSGETGGEHPGWSSPSAILLTLVDLGNSNFGVYWCPATAPRGVGAITYTITEATHATGCVTTETSCSIYGVTDQTQMWIMATDETGSYTGSTKAIQNSGVIDPCDLHTPACEAQTDLLAYKYAGSAAEGIAICTFSAVANWELISLGLPVDTKRITSEFVKTGGASRGLTDDQVFTTWKMDGIGGVYLKSATQLPTDPVNLRSTLANPQVKGVIAQLRFTPGQSFAGVTMATASFHWVVIVGITSKGPLAVTWGTTLQMTWQQWNLEAVTMWKIVTK